MITIQDMQKIAISRGGRCLSVYYLGTDVKLEWQCGKGHIWKNRPSKIKKGQWCPHCAGVFPKGIDYLNGLAQKNRGVCLSSVYPGMQGRAKWRCAYGHEWVAKPNNIRSGTWCPFCAGKYQTITDMQKIAKDRGGLCLSTEFINQITKLEWQCKEGHKWRATPNAIKNGSWCPHCKINYGEEICRAFFEAIFELPFPKTRPDFLRTKPGSSLELDGYCEPIKIAFEHHGKQHYMKSQMFHRGYTDFNNQKYRDIQKLILCQKAGVKVVIIPSIPDYTTLENLPSLINGSLNALGVNLPKSIWNLNVDLNKIYSQSVYDKLIVTANSNGGQLLSKKYLGDRIKLKWRCGKGHIWNATPNSVKNGTWCPICYGNILKSLADVQAQAKSKGFRLLSIEYLGTNKKLLWRCGKGHEWYATPHKLIHETGCPKCAGRKKDIEDMHYLAAQNNGYCLSKTCRGRNNLLEWRCSQGHEFKMTPNYAARYRLRSSNWCPRCRSQKEKEMRAERQLQKLNTIVSKKEGIIVRGEYLNEKSIFTFQCKIGHTWDTKALLIYRGNWCPECGKADNIQQSKKSRLGLQAMQEIAHLRGGECLSKRYKNNATKLWWKCNFEHKWAATPGNVKSGKWCPNCAGKIRKTLLDMHTLAASRGFKFLSNEYLGDGKHHKWVCSKGHEWKAKPSNIKQGRGCPFCSRN